MIGWGLGGVIVPACPPDESEVVATANATDKSIGDLPNSCLIAAREFQAMLQLRYRGVWTRMVQVQYKVKKAPHHAYCTFSLKNGDVWVYDIVNGSVPLSTKHRDIFSIEERLKLLNPVIARAVFLD